MPLDKKQKKIRIFNIVSALIQFALFAACLWFLIDKKESYSDIPVASGEFDLLGCNLLSSYGGVALIALLVAFTFITAVVHSMYAGGAFDYYSRVSRGNNSMRWYEYAVTASIMIFVIALTSGTFDLYAQIFVVVCTFGLMMLGDVVEKCLIKNDKDSRSNVVVTTIIGWALMLTVFGVIVNSFANYNNKLKESGEAGAPDFVYAIVIVMFVLYATFGFIQMYDISKRFKKNASFDAAKHGSSVEMAYTANSMLSKLLLVGILLGSLATRA